MTSSHAARQREPGAGAAGYGPDGGQPGGPGRMPGADLAAAAWPALLAGALGCVVVGILLLAWPKATLAIVAVLIGIALIVAGLQRLIHGFADAEAGGGRRVASVVIGLIAILVGLYAIRHYHLTLTALAIVIGLFWVLNGVSDIAVGLAGPAPAGRGLTTLAGALSLAAGLIVLFWPTISLTVLVVVIGIWLLIDGLILGAMAFALRRAGRGPRVLSGPGAAAPAGGRAGA